MSDEEREALVARMQSATTLSEAEAEMDEAREWLRSHPGDDRVAAAMQRLEERKERLRDPRSAPDWRGVAFSVTVFAVSAVATSGLIYVLSGRLALSVIAGVVLSLEATWLLAGVVPDLLSGIIRNRNGR